MTTAREEVLARIRHAVSDVPGVPAEQDTPIGWVYGRPTPMPDVLARFVETVTDYKAALDEVTDAGLATAVAAALRAHEAASVVVPSGIPVEWVDAIRAAGIEPVADQDLTAAQLDAVDAVVTTSAAGIAETGTIVLDHRVDQGRRALTLVPDVHVCVVRAEQVVSDVPEAVARLSGALRSGRPLTWISGPSATSDIELSRVEGVHGPRTLHVVLVR